MNQYRLSETAEWCESSECFELVNEFSINVNMASMSVGIGDFVQKEFSIMLQNGDQDWWMLSSMEGHIDIYWELID